MTALPDSGACLGTPTLPSLVDAQVPAAGEAFFYVVGVTGAGFDGILGYATGGILRQPSATCF